MKDALAAHDDLHCNNLRTPSHHLLSRCRETIQVSRSGDSSIEESIGREVVPMSRNRRNLKDLFPLAFLVLDAGKYSVR